MSLNNPYPHPTTKNPFHPHHPHPHHPHYSNKNTNDDTAASFLLTNTSTKVLRRTYEATTAIAGKKQRQQQRPYGTSLNRTGSFRSGEESSASSAIGDDDEDDEVYHPKTTDRETIIHLVKGYLGAGCLSLPFAISQLGILGGILSIAALSYWTSANCYTVVNIKRHIERTSPPPQPLAAVASRNNNNNINSNTNDDNNNHHDDAQSETSSNITYPEVGNWAYGAVFQAYVSACIITLQLAVCTVYVSFIGESKYMS